MTIQKISDSSDCQRSASLADRPAGGSCGGSQVAVPALSYLTGSEALYKKQSGFKNMKNICSFIEFYYVALLSSAAPP